MEKSRIQPLIPSLATVRQGAYLPHWTLEGAVYHVVFRLADSLPGDVLRRYQTEREALLSEAGAIDRASSALQDRLQFLFSERVETFLDQGRGACWLAREPVADIVAGALRHFDGARYALLAWCVMPNHVHIVVNPGPSCELSDIVHSWKSFTASEANAVIGRAGRFWQKEYFDHIVRDGRELENTVRYVQENPLKAGLKNWKWVWPG
jgi:REP element-mobilizing transposase RayT